MVNPENAKDFLKMLGEHLNQMSADILGSTPDKLILDTLIEIGLSPEDEVIVTKVEVLNRWDSGLHAEAAEALKKVMLGYKIELVLEENTDGRKI